MIRIGMVVILGAIMVSMGISLYFYVLYQPAIKAVEYGQPVVIGPVEYTITYEGQFEGSSETKPEYEFLQVRIDVKNVSQESTLVSGIQFSLIDENGTRTTPVHGGFSSDDLLYHTIEPKKSATYFTQFDVPFDESATYKIGVEPRKEQETLDYAIVCLLNC